MIYLEYVKRFCVETKAFMWMVFRFYGNNRKALHKRATRGSEGVGPFVKNYILELFDIQILDEDEEGILWLEFSAKLTKLCFCVAIFYLPPADSRRQVGANVFFQTLLQQVYSYQHKGKKFICGDFNARVGSNSDYIEGVDLV